mgnify:CR=1 FL=1
MTESCRTARAVLPGGTEVVHSPGRKVTTDTLLLGLWADPPEGASVCELGCGSAASSAVAARRSPGRFWLGVDLDPSQLRLARRNLTGAGEVRSGLLCCDVFRVPASLSPGVFDLVIMNPPYRVAGRGRSSPDDSRQLARAAGDLALPAFVRAAAHLLRPGGRSLCVSDPRALPRLLMALRAHGLRPRRVQPVGERGRPASLVLTEACAGGCDLVLLPQEGAGELVSLLLE